MSDDSIREAIEDPVGFRLSVAKHFLDKIPASIPNENSLEHFLLETNVDCFLFFSSSITDVVKIEINNRFDLFDKDNVFYIHGIRKKLGNTGAQKQVKDTIARYFSTPMRHDGQNAGIKSGLVHTEQGYFDATNSALWELQVLRNKVAHGRIANISNGQISLDFTIRDRENPKYRRTIENPNAYFSGIFERLTSFVEQVHLPDPQKARPPHHKQLDFRLE